VSHETSAFRPPHPRSATTCRADLDHVRRLAPYFDNDADDGRLRTMAIIAGNCESKLEHTPKYHTKAAKELTRRRSSSARSDGDPKAAVLNSRYRPDE
jgi:hypothetical protein